jgi:hypothetical protein
LIVLLFLLPRVGVDLLAIITQYLIEPVLRFLFSGLG